MPHHLPFLKINFAETNLNPQLRSGNGLVFNDRFSLDTQFERAGGVKIHGMMHEDYLAVILYHNGSITNILHPCRLLKYAVNMGCEG